jgi:hypothetical protein
MASGWLLRGSRSACGLCRWASRAGGCPRFCCVSRSCAGSSAGRIQADGAAACLARRLAVASSARWAVGFSSPSGTSEKDPAPWPQPSPAARAEPEPAGCDCCRRSRLGQLRSFTREDAREFSLEEGVHRGPFDSGWDAVQGSVLAITARSHAITKACPARSVGQDSVVPGAVHRPWPGSVGPSGSGRV